MNDKPKTRRRYDARLRSERATGTRQRILDAARKLFTARGVDTFHIYTLNRAELTEAICRFCGIVPTTAAYSSGNALSSPVASRTSAAA